MLAGPLKCIQYAGNVSGKPFYGKCPEGVDKSCYFFLNGNGKGVGVLSQGCSDSDFFPNTCHVKKWNGHDSHVQCYCNGDGCNIYCAWVDCKPMKNQPNSTIRHFPEIVGNGVQERKWEEECTAKCWPIV